MNSTSASNIAAWLAGIRADAAHPDAVVVVASANGKRVILFAEDIRDSSDEELLEMLSHN